jgi:fibronectin-binding autotransporter adhesin
MASALWMVIFGFAHADTYTWGTPGTTGSWNVTSTGTATASNWYDDTTGATATTVPGASGTTLDDVTIDGDTTNNSTVNFTGQNFVLNSLTISSGDTLNLETSSSGRLSFTNGITNAGTVKVSDSTQLSQISGGTGTLAITNTGTIEAVGTSLEFDAATITNTGGTLSASSGGTINLNGGVSVTGGTFSIDSTSTLDDSNVAATSTFTGVASTNAGTFSWTQIGSGSNRTKVVTFTNGSFGNTGTITLNEESGGGTGDIRSLSFGVSGTNTFTNSNQITIENTTADSASDTESANFIYNPTSGGSLDNTGAITIENSSTGTVASASYFQYAQMTVDNGGGSSFTNTGTINVIQDASGTQDSSHYAALKIADNWTNGGVLIINGTQASLNEAGYTYTQSGTGADTRLLNGGTVTASTVNINTGTLEGSGTVTGATTIANGAHLAPGYLMAGTMAFSSSLALNNTSNVDFQLDMSNMAAGTGGNSLLTISGSFTLDGLLNITAGADFGVGDYILMDYSGTLTDNGLAVNSAPAGYDYSVDTTSDPGSVILDVTAVPEPSTLVLFLAGGLALAGFGATARKLKAASVS